LGAILSAAGPAAAQAPRHSPPPEGSQAFRAILNDSPGQLRPLSRDDFFLWSHLAPGKVLIIVLGKTDLLDVLLSDLDQFLQKGGAVLVATDRNEGGHWQQVLGVQVSGEFHTAPRSLAYRNQEDCPFVKPILNPAVPIFLGLDRIATNKPSDLRPLKPRLSA